MAAPDRSRTVGRGVNSSAKLRLKKRLEEQRKARARRQALLDRGAERQTRTGRGGPNRSGKPVSRTERQGPINLSDPSYKRGNRPSEFRLEQERRRRAGQSFNPNDKRRKPSVEPGTNRLSRAARAQERAETKAAEERAARRRQQRTTAKPTAKPTSKPKAKSGMSDLDKSIAGAQTFIATHKDKGPGMQRAVKKMKERLARLRAKKGAGKSDLAKANRNVA